jgi:hypothetical protein
MDSKKLVRRLLEDGIVTLNNGGIKITKVITEIVGGIEHSKIDIEDGEVNIRYNTVEEVLDYFRMNYDDDALDIDEKSNNQFNQCSYENTIPNASVESNYYFGGAVFDTFGTINSSGVVIDNSKTDIYKMMNNKYGIGNWGRLCDLLELDSDVGVYLVKTKNCLSHSYSNQTTILRNGYTWKTVKVNYVVDGDGLGFGFGF